MMEDEAVERQASGCVGERDAPAPASASWLGGPACLPSSPIPPVSSLRSLPPVALLPHTSAGGRERLAASRCQWDRRLRRREQIWPMRSNVEKLGPLRKNAVSRSCGARALAQQSSCLSNSA